MGKIEEASEKKIIHGTLRQRVSPDLHELSKAVFCYIGPTERTGRPSKKASSFQPLFLAPNPQRRVSFLGNRPSPFSSSSSTTSSRPRQSEAPQNSVCLHGGDVEARGGRRGRVAPPLGGCLSQVRHQRRVRAVRGRDRAARRRVHLRGGLRGPRRLLLRRRAALPVRQPPQPVIRRRPGRALPSHGRRDFAPYRQRLQRRRPVICWWIHGSLCGEEIRSKVSSCLRCQQLILSNRLHPGVRVPERHAPEPLLEGRRLLVVLRQLQLRVRGPELRDQDVELQRHRQRAGGLQPRDTARLLRHRQARGRVQLVVRGVEAEAVLPLWALLQHQGLPGRPVQPVFLALARVISYSFCRQASFCSCYLQPYTVCNQIPCISSISSCIHPLTSQILCICSIIQLLYTLFNVRYKTL